MCLSNISEKQIASEDIVCYKLLESYIEIDYNSTLHGKRFKGFINKKSCTGKICIDNTKIFYCTNKKSLKGCNCDEKFGFKYSWLHDDNVQYLEIDKKSIGKHICKTYYLSNEIEIGKTYFSEIVVCKTTIGEALHSFAKLEDIKSGRYGFSVIAKCIIPKNSNYYEGKFGEHDSYASDTLTYVEIIY